MADGHLNLRVDKGNPDDVELAALTVVLSLLAGEPQAAAEPVRPRRVRSWRPYRAANSWRR